MLNTNRKRNGRKLRFMNVFDRKKKKHRTLLYCPMKGNVSDLSLIPDEVFSEKMIGDGIMIEPEDGVVYAPCDGEITFTFPTKHALNLKTEDGFNVLIHIGLNTVKLDGEGFRMLVSDGDSIKKGDRLLEFDLKTIREHNLSTLSQMIVTNLLPKQGLSIVKQGTSLVGEVVLEVSKNK